MVSRAGAGPDPIPFKTLTAENLAKGIQIALSDDAKTAAEGIAKEIGLESGVQSAVDGFHRLLPLKRMRCVVFPERVAVWQIPDSPMGISSIIAGVLHTERKLDLKTLKLARHKSYDTENQQVRCLCGS
jgi:sterol 3beta-glucosyltransferase